MKKTSLILLFLFIGTGCSSLTEINESIGKRIDCRTDGTCQEDSVVNQLKEENMSLKNAIIDLRTKNVLQEQEIDSLKKELEISGYIVEPSKIDNVQTPVKKKSKTGDPLADILDE